jgi:hypothetical protein
LIIGCLRPISCAAPASARNSRWRENQATMIAATDAQQDVHHDGGDQVADARAVAVVLQQHAVDEVADDARDEDDEGVHHALDQRHRHHVAVGHVRDLVADHRLDLFAVMLCSKPVDTATSAEFLNAPVAKALGSPS